MVRPAHLSAVWVALLLGCGRRATPPEAASSAPPVGHPELLCPPGTRPAGLGPPHGLEAWCEVAPPDQADSIRQGPSLEWHPNGRRAGSGSYDGGQRTGTWQFWYATGIPLKQGTFSNGLEEGPWTAYHPDGTPASEGSYVGGKEDGPWTYWDPATLVRTEGQFVQGARVGRWIDRGPDDRPVRERVYRNGRLVNQRELGP